MSLLNLSWAYAHSSEPFSDYYSLAAKLTKNVDYRIQVKDRSHPLTVVAIHAGGIEFGTGEIAQALAGEEFNLYLFEGLRSSGNWDLHVTSKNFNEPQLLQLVVGSDWVISLHGLNNDEQELILFGGQNHWLKNKIFRQLKQDGWITQNHPNPLQEFLALEPENFVNQALHSGVQLEISSKLRQRLLRSPQQLHAFAQSIKQALIGCSLALQ